VAVSLVMELDDDWPCWDAVSCEDDWLAVAPWSVDDGLEAVEFPAAAAAPAMESAAAAIAIFLRSIG
jgi:hypothetical protein